LRAKVSRIEIYPEVGAARIAARLAASPASASIHHGA
jgi:hypothetical protein